MIYKEYEKATKRHRETCEFLLLELKASNNCIDVHKQRKLLENIYYLSGYVIECIVSYAFFDILHYDPQRSVYDLGKNDNYDGQFAGALREHSNKANQYKIEVILQRGGNIPSSIPLIGDGDVDSVSEKMYKQWNARSRYTTSHLDFELNIINVEKFFGLSSIIYSKMKNI